MGKSKHLSVGTGTQPRIEVDARTDSGEFGGLLTGERVQIDGRQGVFVVLRTDEDRGTVDVLQISGLRQIMGGIPVDSVRVLSDLNLLARLLGAEG